ncbi:ribonuclease Oy isoform X2 [Ooceraea biroi]|uniref:ribonuclease Oy isoform X2 n=1 Tax=Ooceraea biroi TaxID=2015173 RepID=UPI0005BCA29C|nr:ribonuclease Oy isoform X2 [Ooceraea biroi]
MRKHNITLFVLLLSLLCVTHGFNRRRRQRFTSNEFDVLMFTQRWPPTACFVWKENSESRSCSLPKREEWTIHGIWPTKYHTIGPEYCNDLPFNPNMLAPLESELKENWIDIQNGSRPYTFWKHEWDKHGTCAITVQALNSEYNYFLAALNLLDTYNMIDVLAKASILPGQRYMVQDILAGIEKVLGKRSQVMCAKNEKTGESYMVEIRTCFDKTLQLVDCDGIVSFPTNCNRREPITYPRRQWLHHSTFF